MAKKVSARRALFTGINEVFTVEPRNAKANPQNWIPRPELLLLQQKLLSSGLSICIDGPTGVGKSSLAESGLYEICTEEDFWSGYVVIQCHNGMSWGDVCWQTVQSLHEVDVLPNKGHLSEEARLDISAYFIKFGMKLDLSDFTQTAKLRDYVQTWGVYELARLVSETKTIICLDDAEKLDTELFVQLADFCKKLSGTLPGKLVLVGMGDIYTRTLVQDTSLSGRFDEIVLGGLTKQVRLSSWNFICSGLQKLGFDEPRAALKKRKTKKLADAVAQCIEQIDDATGGIPKLLNLLGAQIATYSAGSNSERRIVSPADILIVTEQFIRDQISTNSDAHKELIATLRADLASRLVLSALYVEGISHACSIDRIVEIIDKRQAGNSEPLDRKVVLDAINRLVKQGTLVRTGPSSTTIYAIDPSIVHSFGVAVRQREKYGISDDHFSDVGQLQLPFFAD